MDLRNWEMFAGTGAAVVGADVSVYEAELDHPNPNSALDTTTTDGSGMWAFTGLSDTAKDVKVEYSDRVKWYKGLTLHSVYAVRENAEDDHVEQNLAENGGFEVNTTGTSSWTPGTSNGAILDKWEARRGVGDTLTLNWSTTQKSTNSDRSIEAVYVKSAGDAYVELSLPSLLAVSLRGKTISGSAQVYQGAASACKFYITDGTTTTEASASATTGSFITSPVENFLVDNAATSVKIGVTIEVSGTHYLDNVMLNFGTEAETYVMRFSDSDLSFTIVEAAPSSDTARLGTLLNNLAERVRTIIGAAGNDWKDTVPINLTTLLASVAAKLPLAGGVMTGALKLTNNVALQALEVSTFARDVVKMNTSDQLELGNPNVVTLLLAASVRLANQVPLQLIEAGAAVRAAFVMNSSNQIEVGNINNTLKLLGPVEAVQMELSGNLEAAELDLTGSTGGVSLRSPAGITIAGTSVLARSSHTGFQTAATIADFAATVATLTAASANAIADGAVSTAAKIANGIITDAKIAAANKDGVAGTASMRTLGTGAAQAAAGNHTHAAGDAATLDGIDSTGFARLAAASNFTTAPTINGGTVWHSGNDGAGSGLDADTLDGSSSAAFATAGHTHSDPTGMAKVATNTYTGNGAASRGITGLGFAPKFGIVQVIAGATGGMFLYLDHDIVALANGLSAAFHTGNTLDADGFTVTNAAGTNTNTATYRYVMFG